MVKTIKKTKAIEIFLEEQDDKTQYISTSVDDEFSKEDAINILKEAIRIMKLED
jgi:hypothetical protein